MGKVNLTLGSLFDGSGDSRSPGFWRESRPYGLRKLSRSLSA